MPLRAGPIALVICLGALRLAAQTSTVAPGVTYLSSAHIDSGTAAALAAGTVTHPLAASSGGLQYLAAVRQAPGSAEIHTRWTDIVMVRSGHGTLRTGRVIPARRESAPGEWRGATISDGHDQPLGAGDVVVIPAGTAHQYIPAGDAPLVYVTVKVRGSASRSQR